MAKLFEIFKKHMSTPTEVVDMALDANFSQPPSADFVKKNFSKLVEKLQIDAYNVYLQEQKKNGEIAINDYLADAIKLRKNATANDVVSIASKSFEELDKFFLSLAQSRKQRAGSAFEDIIKTLFKKLSYPFQEQQVINGKPDFLMPSKAYYDINAMDCIVFTAKRTLRERWRQIATEGVPGRGFYLATIDEDVSESQLGEMKSNNIYLVVPERLNKEIEHYSKAPNVMSFEDFFEDHLDPAVKRWRKANVI